MRIKATSAYLNVVFYRPCTPADTTPPHYWHGDMIRTTLEHTSLKQYS